MRAVTMAAVVIMTACAGQQLDPELQSYVGQHVDTVSAKLGAPAKQSVQGSVTEYAWMKKNTVDGIVDYKQIDSVATQSAQGSSRFDSASCTLKATADGFGIIKGFSSSGDCARTIDLLR
jgi:hypothetical protein